jgi:IS5 family transposase
MKQANWIFELSTKSTLEHKVLDVMNRVVPWARFVALIGPYSPRARIGRPPFPIETILLNHFLR